MADAERVHFYSYATGVSLELPVGFERAAEDDSSATYAELDDDGDPAAGSAQVQVQVVGTFEDETTDAERHQTVAALAGGFAETEGEVLGQVERVVDEEPVSTVTIRRADGVLLHLSAAASEHRLLSLVATATDEGLLPLYDEAIDSIRFIEL